MDFIDEVWHANYALANTALERMKILKCELVRW